MPRYVVERTFPDGLIIPMNETGAELCRSVVSNNAQDQVTWVHSYVSQDKQKSYCIYDEPSPEAILTRHSPHSPEMVFPRARSSCASKGDFRHQTSIGATHAATNLRCGSSCCVGDRRYRVRE